jgi:hypothetical protein
VVAEEASGVGSARWLLLTHQLPPQPAYQRVKIWRRLQVIGAVAVKKSVYALPYSDEGLEDFLWTAKEVEAGGGEALVCEARLLQGMTDEQLRALFDAAREADYEALIGEATGLQRLLAKRRIVPADLRAAETAVRRLRRRFKDIAEIDFFGANAREAADGLVRDLEARVAGLMAPARSPAPEQTAVPREKLQGRTWVTRRGVKIDRVACAWLIRRFIDAKAVFRFVDPTDYRHTPGELRFDMASAEFTHRGDRCSFEVLLDEAKLTETALAAIAEIVHDLDLKDDKFGRPETEGVRHVIAGLVLASDDDQARIDQASALFDNLYRSLQQKPTRTRDRR